MSDAESDAEFSNEDFRATATAFSQATGVLGGFCITIFVLVLPPEFLKDYPSAKDWVIGLILLAAFFYVYASLMLAHSMNSRVIKDIRLRISSFRFGIALLHLANISLCCTLSILVWFFSSTVGVITIFVIVTATTAVAIYNFGIGLGFLKGS